MNGQGGGPNDTKSSKLNVPVAVDVSESNSLNPVLVNRDFDMQEGNDICELCGKIFELHHPDLNFELYSQLREIQELLDNMGDSYQ